MKRYFAWGLLILCSAFSTAVFAHEDRANMPPPDPAYVYGEQLGSVTVPFACSDAAAGSARRGLALLHHMTYVGARAAFVDTASSDPECAMGFWGQAMSYIHPLWSDPPGQGDFEKGQALVAEAAKRAKTDREMAYIDAVKFYYDQGRHPTEKANLSAFAEGWRKVYERFPEDLEGVAFYALAHLATANPADKSYAVQKRSAAIAKQVLQRNPGHPGAHHYTIHALDYPPLAEQALEVARSYGRIAPEVPHALHMPAHIFTRLGLWPESIDMNRRSADAALKHPANGKISLHYLHALDYLAYAYLQRGEDGKAQTVLDELMALKGPYQTHVASAYTFAAVPARLALERQQWAVAVTLKPQTPSNYPWQINPAMEAITFFANGLGAAHTGDTVGASRAIDRLAVLKEKAAKSSDYWAKQIEVQRLTVAAWSVYGQGKKQAGLTIMRRAAAMEATTEKHPVTPGEVLPAQELLADMLFDLGRYEDALVNYQAALKRSPNRLNSLYGAGRSAELAGHKDAAVSYFQKLLKISAADSGVKRLQEARSFLETGR